MFVLVKLKLNFFSGDPKLPLILLVRHSPAIKKSFLWLSEWDDELLSTPKIITFLATFLSKNSMKLHYQMFFRIHYIHTSLYHYFYYISIFLFISILFLLYYFTIVAPNKQFLILKSLVVFPIKHLNHRQCKH